MRIIKALFLVIAVFIYSCQVQGQNYERVDVDKFENSISDQSDPQILDVRTPDEYSLGHLEDSELINFYDDNFGTQVLRLDKSKPVFVYCASGGRSRKASEMLTDMGFSKVYDLDGGINAWSTSGKKVVRD